ncbi:MAG: O-antigen ligase family protein [Thermodesulfobacteriota bacterium]|nr:O-antigen ligase family protein [Thermodesulfobacteriota bacterium]
METTENITAVNNHPKPKKRISEDEINGISRFSFVVYLYFIVDFLLHFSARIPGYGMLQPTLIGFLVIALSLFFQKEKIEHVTQDPIFKAIMALLIYIMLSLPFVEWPGSVVKNNLENFVKATAFFFFTAMIIDTRKRLCIFLFFFIGCQTFRALEPLYLHLTTGYMGSVTYISPGEFAGRLSGAPADVVNPNGLGFVIVTIIPFLHYLLFKANKKGAFLYFCLLPLLLYALMLTQSRGAFLGLLVVAWIIFLKSRHKILMIMVFVIISATGWNLMTPIQKDRYMSLVDKDAESASSVDGRISLILHEFQLGFERPIVGHGLGTTIEAKVHSWRKQQASHNLYGQLLIEIGLIGAILFFRFLWQIYKCFKQNNLFLKQVANQKDFDFFLRLNQAMIAVFWMYVVYSVNYYGLSQYYWYLFGGLALAVGRLLKKYPAYPELTPETE